MPVEVGCRSKRMPVEVDARRSGMPVEEDAGRRGCRSKWDAGRRGCRSKRMPGRSGCRVEEDARSEWMLAMPGPSLRREDRGGGDSPKAEGRQEISIDGPTTPHRVATDPL
jgi:hypothetical protein